MIYSSAHSSSSSNAPLDEVVLVTVFRPLFHWNGIGARRPSCACVPYLSYDLGSFFEVDWRERLREGLQVVISAFLEENAVLDGAQDEFVCVVRFRDRLRRAYVCEKANARKARLTGEQGAESRVQGAVRRSIKAEQVKNAEQVPPSQVLVWLEHCFQQYVARRVGVLTF